MAELLETPFPRRKNVADELKASREEMTGLKAALDEHAIVAIADPQGRITYVSVKAAFEPTAKTGGIG